MSVDPQPTPQFQAQAPPALPVPDPTALTTAQLLRELAWLRETINGRLAVGDLDRAWLKTELDKIPNYIEEKVSRWSSIHDERFKSVQTQFQERDVRVEQTARDTKTAVDAALQAQKEAAGATTEASDRSIAKSEAATAEQIRQLQTFAQSQNESVRAVIDDIKERLTRLEGLGIGRQTEQTSHQASSTWVLSLGLGAISLIGLIIVIIRDLVVK